MPAWRLPAGQTVHVEAPAAAANLPASQLVHTLARVAEYVPAAQLEQATAPVAAL